MSKAVLQKEVLGCSGLHKTYHGLEVAVLNGIDLTVNAGVLRAFGAAEVQF